MRPRGQSSGCPPPGLNPSSPESSPRSPRRRLRGNGDPDLRVALVITLSTWVSFACLPTHPWPLLCKATNVRGGDLTPGGCSYDPTEVPRQSSDPLFQLPPPSKGERPPGATAEPPSAPSGVSRAWVGTEEPLAVPFRDPVAHPFQVKTNLRVVAPSLTSQAAAQAANQALIRSDPARGGGPRAAGARRVSPALPSSLQCGSYPPEPCSTPLPPEQDPRLRAGPFPPAPGGPGTPTRPKDVWHLGLAGGPGRSQSCAWRLLPGLWDRVPLGAGPPAPAPRTACVSRPPASSSSRQPGAVPQPPAHLPPLSICIRVPGGFSEPLSPKGE